MIKNNKLTKRQQFILRYIEKSTIASNQSILEDVRNNFDKYSRITVIRDLNKLLDLGLIERVGKGRSVVYQSTSSYFIREFDDLYFNTEPDKRIIKKDKIEFNQPEKIVEILTKDELEVVENLTKKYRNHLAEYSFDQIKRELERITIEFSWKSSQIEGNTYSLLDTERLIRENKEAEGKAHNEATMILNHKVALDYIWNNADYFKKISPKKIEEIHDLVSKDLAIAKGFRKRPVGIVGTAYMPYDNVYQIKEAINSLCKLLENISNPFIRALISVATIAYIQPFEDGNKRTSRLIGNAILLANNYCPLSYRSIDEIEYKKAIILFYEQHSIAYFKRLFIDQYNFAVQNYFQ